MSGLAPSQSLLTDQPLQRVTVCQHPSNKLEQTHESVNGLRKSLIASALPWVLLNIDMGNGGLYTFFLLIVQSSGSVEVK